MSKRATSSAPVETPPAPVTITAWDVRELVSNRASALVEDTTGAVFVLPYADQFGMREREVVLTPEQAASYLTETGSYAAAAAQITAELRFEMAASA